jgi:hypothetical protein
VLALSLFGALIVLAQIQQMSRPSPEAQISIQAE